MQSVSRNEFVRNASRPPERRVPVDERKNEAVLAPQAPRGRELRFGIVDADDVGAAAREPRRDVRGAAAELDRPFSR
jgi:hypothetical protein